jgi:hypothetical protein
MVLVALICGENEVNNNRYIKRMQLIGRSILSMNETTTIIMACVVGVRKLRRKGFCLFLFFFCFRCLPLQCIAQQQQLRKLEFLGIVMGFLYIIKKKKLGFFYNNGCGNYS